MIGLAEQYGKVGGLLVHVLEDVIHRNNTIDSGQSGIVGRSDAVT